EEAVFATDLADENVLSIGKEGDVLVDGRATLHRRGESSPCERCQLETVCTRLDQRYIQSEGDHELHPIREPEALTAFFAAGLARYELGPSLRKPIEDVLARRNAPALPVRAHVPSPVEARGVSPGTT